MVLTHKTSACASITTNGVPTNPLHVCAAILHSSGTRFHYQFVCDSTRSSVLMSVHLVADCSDAEVIQIPFPLEGGMDVNCEQIYDCSFAIYRLYNDTTGQCIHSPQTGYLELPVVMDECAYDISTGGSVKYSCDNNVIYSDVQMGDTQGACENTVQTTFVQEGCDPTTGQYQQVITCIYNDKNTSGSGGSPAIAGVTLIIIIVVCGGVVLIALIVGILCYRKNKQKSHSGYSHVSPVPVPQPPNVQSHEGPHTNDTITNIETVPIKTYYIQNRNEIVAAPVGPVPPPPPLPLPEKENKIFQWLKENIKISETDAKKYSRVFVENGFDDVREFKDITMQDLVEIGFKKLGHRKLIMNAIEANDNLLAPI